MQAYTRDRSSRRVLEMSRVDKDVSGLKQVGETQFSVRRGRAENKENTGTPLAVLLV
jgi:hypothetical protein